MKLVSADHAALAHILNRLQHHAEAGERRDIFKRKSRFAGGWAEGADKRFSGGLLIRTVEGYVVLKDDDGGDIEVTADSPGEVVRQLRIRAGIPAERIEVPQ